MDIDLRFVGRPFNLDARDAGMIKPTLKEFFHPKIFMQQFGIIMAGKPLGVPGLNHAEPKNLRVSFLTHWA
jgi:hypothetical protein